jgi:hypothetical protein
MSQKWFYKFGYPVNVCLNYWGGYYFCFNLIGKQQYGYTFKVFDLLHQLRYCIYELGYWNHCKILIRNFAANGD